MCAQTECCIFGEVCLDGHFDTSIRYLGYIVGKLLWSECHKFNKNIKHIPWAFLCQLCDVVTNITQWGILKSVLWFKDVYLGCFFEKNYKLACSVYQEMWVFGLKNQPNHTRAYIAFSHFCAKLETL